MNFELNTQQKEAQAAFKAFVDREIVPVADEFDRQEHLPASLISKLAQAGYLGAIESRAAKNVRGLRDINITASFGVCEFNKHKTCEDLIRDADEALYMAKEEGRNQVKLHKPTLQAVTA